MGVVLGSMTSAGAGAVSANWGVSGQVNRLYALGSMDPFDERIIMMESVNITFYGGSGPTVPINTSMSCANSSTKFSASITPGGCGASSGGLSGSFFLMSYSYSKNDPVGYGQATYNGQRWTSDPQPTVLCGIAEGSSSGGVNSGVAISESYEGSQGSVSAGFPGVGWAATVSYGLVSSVGPGAGKADGSQGQGNATVQHQPIWIGA